MLLQAQAVVLPAPRCWVGKVWGTRRPWGWGFGNTPRRQGPGDGEGVEEGRAGRAGPARGFTRGHTMGCRHPGEQSLSLGAGRPYLPRPVSCLASRGLGTPDLQKACVEWGPTLVGSWGAHRQRGQAGPSLWPHLQQPPGELAPVNLNLRSLMGKVFVCPLPQVPSLRVNIRCFSRCYKRARHSMVAGTVSGPGRPVSACGHQLGLQGVGGH